MKAFGVYKALPISDPEALLEVETPMPSVSQRDLLVKVEAVSVNPADWRMRSRKADDGQIVVLGWDVAGRVVEAGSDVVGFAAGDAVYYAGDLTRPGADSEFHVVDSRIVGKRPKTLDAAESAALPLTTLTAWEAIFERFAFSIDRSHDGQTLLVVGGAGGVESMAIQLARLVPGLRVVATASRAESRAWCERFGAHAIVDHFGDMGAQLAALGLPPVTAILCANDPDRHFDALADIVAPQGAICSIIPFAQPPDVNRLMRKSASLLWEFMFTRSMFNTSDIACQGRILDDVAKLVDGGRIATTLSQRLGPINAANLRKAHAIIEGGRMVGKLVLAGFQAD